MILTRRAAIGGLAGGLAATRAGAKALSVSPPSRVQSYAAGRGRGYRDALELIRTHALAELAATGLPGMTIAVADDTGLTAGIFAGVADLRSGTPVDGTHLFEIGSISKSLTGLWLHAAAARGQVDLDAPVSRYLPDVPLPAGPITVQQLLDHVGGLPGDAPIFPRVPGGRLWSGFRPGARFSYSNVGYDLLGLVVDRIAGRPHPAVLDAEVIAPLGMARATAHIRTADRPRFATGYVQLLSDRPALTRTALREGPWTEEDIAAGAVAATASDMCGYLRYVIGLGRGRGGPLMPDAAAKAMLATDVPADEFGRGARYASGIATQFVDGRPLLHHTGGMLMFSSSFHVDAAAGVGCFASVNGRLDEYRPRAVTRYAVEVLRAAREGRPLPAAPDPFAFRRVADPKRFVGRWVGPDGEAWDIAAGPDGTLALATGDGRYRLEPVGANALATDHPRLGPHRLEFGPGQGGFTRLWWGGTLYGREAALPQPPVPDRLRALAGSYVTHDPWAWAGPCDVLARGERLVIEGVGEIVERPGGFWSSVEDEGGVDRFWFDAPVNGRPSRLNADGYDLLRIG